MWTLPGPRLAMAYNVLTVLFAIPCCYVFMRVMLSDLSSSNETLDGLGLIVGAAWLVIPLLSLAGVAAATFPSVKPHTKAVLSSLSFGLVTVLAVLPLIVMFVV